MTDLSLKGKAAVQKHIQDLFYGYPVTVISIKDQLQIDAPFMEIADYLISESVRRDKEEGV